MSRRTQQIIAIQRGMQPALDKLRELHARCCEQRFDAESGILTERWMTPEGRFVILYGTEDWRDVYAPICAANDWKQTLDALASYAKEKP